MGEDDDQVRSALSSLPRRVIRRLIRDLRHDYQETKQRGAKSIPSAINLFVEKWLGFWYAVIGFTYTVGLLGMGLIYAGEAGSNIPALSSTIPWALDHIWTVGALIILTYGVILFSLLLVTASRIILWCRDSYLKYWKRDTPPFTADTSEIHSEEWPPSEEQQENAWNHTKNYIGNGMILFASVFSLGVLFDQIARKTLTNLLSSRLLTIFGNSIDIGIGILDFNSVLTVAAPNASQPQVVLFVVFFVFPAAVMAIGIRNLLYLFEGHVKGHVENICEGNYISWSTGVLTVMFLYSLSVCGNIIIQWV